MSQAKVEYLGQQIRVLEPFIKRLQDLQDRKFTLPEGVAMTVDLGEPDAQSRGVISHLLLPETKRQMILAEIHPFER